MSGWLLQNSLIAGTLASLVLLASRCWRISPAVRHALWLIVLLKLTVPPLLELSIEVTAWDAQTAGVETQQIDDPRHSGVYQNPEPPLRLADGGSAGAIDEADEPPSELLLAEIAGDETAEKALGNEHAATGSIRREHRSSGTWSPCPILYVCWSMGCLLVVVFHVRRIVRFRRILSQGEHVPTWLDDEAQRVAERMRMSAPRIAVLRGLAGPFVWGLGPPRLLWPADFESRVEPAGVTAILVHELAHLRRRDHWVRRVEVLLSCVWWWHPLFWIVRRQLHETAEQACDAWVIALHPESRRRYAAALIDVCEMRASVSVPVSALGVASRARRCFERRLKMILRERVSCQIPRFAAPVLAILALLVLPAWTLGQPAATEEAPRTGAVPETGFAPPADRSKSPEPERSLLAEPPATDEAPRPESAPVFSFDVGFARGAAPSASSTSPLAEPPATSASGFTFALPALPEPSNDTARDERVEALERQLRAALKELEQLKATRVQTGVPLRRAGSAEGPAATKKATEDEIPAVFRRRPTPSVTSEAAPALTRLPVLADPFGATPNYRVETLQRARFELPEEKAAAFGEFLKQFGPEEVEVRVEGTAIIVTTTEDSLRAIAQFVELLKRPKSGAAFVPAGSRSSSGGRSVLSQ